MKSVRRKLSVIYYTTRINYAYTRIVPFRFLLIRSRSLSTHACVFISVYTARLAFISSMRHVIENTSQYYVHHKKRYSEVTVQVHIGYLRVSAVW